jgi:hypothetical protein
LCIHYLKFCAVYIVIMDDQGIFWSICIVSLVLGKVVSDYIFPNPSKFLESYGGFNRGQSGCKKFDEIFYQGKRYRRINSYPIQESSKMTYKYCKIYNVSKSEWAHDVSGDDDASKIWADNEWDEHDAIIGFFSDRNGDFHNVIYCRPGYAVFIQGEEEKAKTDFEFEDETIRIPPAILVNLNNAYDTEFLHSKAHPSDMDDGDDECDCDCDCDDDDDDDDSESDDEDNDSDDSESDDEDEDVINTKKTAVSHIPKNQRVIEFLYKCSDAADNKYKKAAYTKAIDEIHSYWDTINPVTWKPWSIGPSIERKIREFIDGIDEDDIIYS